VNDEEVEALCHRYGPMVIRRCQRLLGNAEEARDAAQDVFVRLVQHRARLDGAYPSSLMYRMATNVCLNRIRERSRRPTTDEERLLARIATADEPGAQSHARMMLDRLFARQPESSRAMAVLHFVDGLTLEQVAEVTGLSVSGVRKRLRRLRESLREVG
jgi:RNA polymerase sigma-70 factor (ECF subfamily)